MALLQAKGKKSVKIQDCGQVGVFCLTPKEEVSLLECHFPWELILGGMAQSSDALLHMNQALPVMRKTTCCIEDRTEE